MCPGHQGYGWGHLRGQTRSPAQARSIWGRRGSSHRGLGRTCPSPCGAELSPNDRIRSARGRAVGAQPLRGGSCRPEAVSPQEPFGNGQIQDAEGPGIPVHVG